MPRRGSAAGSLTNSCRSAMIQATTDEDPRRALRAECRRRAAPRTTMKARKKSECSMPETGPIAPARTLVAVRAIVPVAQMPAEQRREADVGDALGDELAIRAMPTAAHGVGDDGGEERFDAAEEARARAHPAAPSPYASSAHHPAGAGSGSAFGMPPKRVPMVSTGRPKSAGRRNRAANGDEEGRARSAASAARARIVATAPAAIAERGGVPGARLPPQGLELGQERRRLLARQRQAEEVAQLAREDDRRDAGGEADRSPVAGCT